MPDHQPRVSLQNLLQENGLPHPGWHRQLQYEQPDIVKGSAGYPQHRERRACHEDIKTPVF